MKKRNRLRYIISGDIFTEDFLVKQSKLILLIVFFIILFISNRYSCTKKLIEMEILKKQLKDIKYENLVLSVEMISNRRLSKLEKLLKLKGIKLSTYKESVFKLPNVTDVR